jgi:oxygen-independent coproporphyrinogen-3 oxidase
MYEIPGQTFESWSYTLNQLSTLPITHLSLYNLTIEPHTLYYKKRKTLIPLLPPAEVSLNMLQVAVDFLEGIGLKRYEISAFSHPGLESRHNLGYWTARPFIGIGPSAFSYYDKKRLRNICHLKNYAQALQEGKSPIDFEEALSDAHSLHELLAVRLRLLSGVDMRDFPVPKSLYQSLQDKGWLTIEKDRACLTDQGLLFYDSVATEIIL